MEIVKTAIEDVLILKPKLFRDNRGFFTESYSKRTFEKLGLNYNMIQDNHSLSVQTGTIRGLHYQLDPKAQAKIVRVVAGSIYDVSVDIRRGSPTFGKWVGVKVTAESCDQLLVPKGFAHGFCTLEPNTEVFYKVDEFYAPECDRSIRYDDPEFGIDWPCKEAHLSEKDLAAPFFAEAEINFKYPGAPA